MQGAETWCLIQLEVFNKCSFALLWLLIEVSLLIMLPRIKIKIFCSVCNRSSVVRVGPEENKNGSSSGSAEEVARKHTVVATAWKGNIDRHSWEIGPLFRGNQTAVDGNCPTMEKPQGKSNVWGLEMLDYKSIIRLKKLGLSHGAIAARLGCKWESVCLITTLFMLSVSTYLGTPM